MKNVIAILLLLVTALYVLPHGTFFSKNCSITAKCSDTPGDDSGETKKEASKEFVTSPLPVIVAATAASGYTSTLPIKPVMMYGTVLTPPPDRL